MVARHLKYLREQHSKLLEEADQGRVEKQAVDYPRPKFGTKNKTENKITSTPTHTRDM